MIDVRPEVSAPPLSAEELEKDAKDRGVEVDETVRKGSGTHLPASETDHIPETEDGKASPGSEADKLPPD